MATDEWARCEECDGEFDIADLDGDGLCADCHEKIFMADDDRED